MIPTVTDSATGRPIGPPVPGEAARRPDRATILQGRHVRLLPIDPAAHEADLFEGAHGPERDALWLYLTPPPFADRAQFRHYLDAAAASDDPFMYAIVEQGSGRAVGHATFMRIEPAHRVIEVGNILFTPALQRSPGATEAMYLMARHAFEGLGYRRYEWKCNALNAPSRRAALRYGFAFEGEFRRHMIVKGRSRDTAWFSMLDTEWPARRLAFERWLDPGNFDGAGRQRLSLSALNATELGRGAEPLRRAGPDDVEAFAALQEAAFAWNRRELGAEPLPLLVPAPEVLARYETWLLDEEGRLVAAMALEPFPDHLLVWSLAVDPARQNAGLGRRLLVLAEERARDLGLSTLRLYTGERLGKNVEWYRRRGYAVEKVEEGANGLRAVHMVKTIGS